MRKKSVVFGLLICFFYCVALGNSAANGQNKRIYSIELSDDIDMGLAVIVERGMAEAESNKGDAVIIKIDTFGGLSAAATRIRDSIILSPVPVITFVNGRAWSAGALIALAGDYLVMVPGASIGDAEPIPTTEKNIAAIRGEFKATAERRDKDPVLAMAMVDKDIYIEDVVEKGKLLTLTATGAEIHGISDATVASFQELLRYFDLEDHQIIEVKPRSIETFARAVTNSWLSGLLLTIGFVGLFVEVTTPGWGVPGTLGILSLAAFFTGHLLTGTSNLSIVILFFVGLFLLVLEIFVIPGFGITGIGGILAVLASLFLAFPNFDIAFKVVSSSFLATIVLIVILMRFLPRSPVWQRLSLSATETVEEGYVAGPDRGDLLGAQGETITTLRPVGTIKIGDRKMDAVSESAFVEKGVTVEVVKIEGSKVIVRKHNE